MALEFTEEELKLLSASLAESIHNNRVAPGDWATDRAEALLPIFNKVENAWKDMEDERHRSN